MALRELWRGRFANRDRGTRSRATEPHSRDGRRIFYNTPDRERMSVEIDVKKEVVKRIEACRAHGYNRAGVSRVSI